MLLKRLELVGFKSFVTKTTLEFPAGITAIVGPNGSGKCLDGESLVFLADGRRIKIRDLVEERLVRGPTEKMDDGWISRDNSENTHVVALDVETQRMKPARVAAFVKRTAPDYMIEIKTRSGRSVKATPYHPFFTMREGKIVALRADEVAAGTKIIAPRRLPVTAYDDALPQIEILAAFRESDTTYIPYSSELRSFILQTAAWYGSVRKLCEAVGTGYERIRTVWDGQALNLVSFLPILAAGESAAQFEIPVIQSMRRGRLRIPGRLTPELARFLGYIISEGRNNLAADQIRFVNSDRALLDDFREVSEKVFGLIPREFAYKATSTDSIIFSKTLCLFLERIFGIVRGEGAAQKRVPGQLFRASPKIVWSFIGALFEGDGYFHLTERGNKHQAYVEYATASRELAEGVQTLLLREGVLSRIHAKEKHAANTVKKTKRTYYSVFISGSDNVRALTKNLCLFGEKKATLARMARLKLAPNPNLDVIPGAAPLVKSLVKETGISVKRIRAECPRLAAYYEDRCEFSRAGIREVLSVIVKRGTITGKSEACISMLERIAASDVYYDEVREVRRIASPAWVYDLCVEGDHNFVANNMIVHNSNLIDGIRWLLGEREAKNIRGGKVEDLIFAGTPERARAGFARASLVFDNRTKFFPLDYAEIEVSRKISRDGASEYFLNDAAVRLKDLVHFFAQSKLGTKGLTIVNQGNADLFVRVTPEERREMIEEILGLRQFHIKKHEAERKLVATGFNLEKAHAMIDELLPHLRLLRKQAARFAEKEQYEKELRELEDNYFGFRLAQLARDADASAPRIKELERLIARAEEEVAKAGAELAAVEGGQPRDGTETQANKKKQAATLSRRAALERELGRVEAQLEMLARRPAREADAGAALRLLHEVKDVLESARALSDLNAVRAKLEEALAKIAGMESKEDGGASDEARTLNETKLRLAADLTKLAEELAEYEAASAAREQALSGFTESFKRAHEALEKEKDALASLREERSTFMLAEERTLLRREELENLARQSGRKLSEFKSLEGVLIEADAVERRMFKLRGELGAIGEMDPALVKDAQETEARYTFLQSQVADLEKAAKDLKVLIHDLDQKLHREFTAALHAITEQFNHYFRLMFGGGRARMKLVKKEVFENNNRENGEEFIREETRDEASFAKIAEKDAGHKVDHGGIEIDLSIPRKKVSGLDMLSGGERSLVSIAALFALISVSTPPFLVLDEVDAALDEVNTKRFANLVKDFAAKTQFVIVTHNRATMEVADILYGVTMGEDGTSRVLSLKLES